MGGFALYYEIKKQNYKILMPLAFAGAMPLAGLGLRVDRSWSIDELRLRQTFIKKKEKDLSCCSVCAQTTFIKGLRGHSRFRST